MEREVHAYAIDSEGGPNNELVNSPKTLKCDPKPVAAASAPDAGAAVAPSDGNGLLPLDDESGCSVGPASDAHIHTGWSGAVGAFVIFSLRRRRR